MHCYVINLPTATKRLERTKRELETYCPGIKWSVPPMCVASEWKDEQFSKLYDQKRARELNKRDLSRGEVACAISHQSAMREFLKTDDEICLIVEDDVMLSPAIGDFLAGVVPWCDSRKNIPTCVILSEAAAVRYWAARKWFGEYRRTSPVRIWGAIAYVMNRAGAQLMLKVNSRPFHATSDYWGYYRGQGLSVFGVNKVLAASFDFERIDSSLASGRAKVARNVVCQRTIVVRIIDAVFNRITKLLWLITAMNIRGMDRSSMRLYRYEEHG